MHKVADQITTATRIPLLHIADATAQRIRQAGVKRVGLLATAFTMEQEFYKGRLEQQYDIEVLVPDATGRKTVHDIIYQELCLGVIREESRAQYRDIIAQLVAEGAEAIILGCTEITLLVKAEDAAVPLFDTINPCAGRGEAGAGNK